MNAQAVLSFDQAFVRNSARPGLTPQARLP